MTPVRRILVVDDDCDICEFISATAEAMGLHCTATTEAATFLEALTPDTDLIMLDLMMPEMDGIELLRRLDQQQCKVNIILISGIGKRVMESAEELAQAHGLSIVGHLQKPFRVADLEEILKKYTQPTAAPVAQFKSKIVVRDAELRRAIKRNEFILHYQPQIDILTGAVVGLEALVRWQHPERGLIFPDDFITRIEDLNLIDQLGWIVANRALSELKMFAGKDGTTPMLSINVSVSSLHDLKFPDIMASLISEHGVSPEKVVLEITESGLIQELTSTLDVLTRLRMKQIQLSIDDFGTGYSMMQQLHHIPATELKIEKSFVQNMLTTNRDLVMVEKTIEIGHELGMRVVAEGVNTLDQLEVLRSNSCDLAQGYLFSHPLPAEGTLELERGLPRLCLAKIHPVAEQPCFSFESYVLQ